MGIFLHTAKTLNITIMKWITRLLAMALLIHSCSPLEIFPSTKGYEWDIDTTNIFVSTDKFSRVELLGKRIPPKVVWSASPEGVVTLEPNSQGCTVRYLSDGEGTITASYGDTQRRCTFVSEYYSHTGLHMKINGQERYFPMIEHNGEGDGIGKITRIYHFKVPRDTLRIEIKDFIPQESRDKIVVKNIYLTDSGHHYGCNKFLNYNDPFRVSDSAISYRDTSPNFWKVKGVYMEQYALAQYPEVTDVTLEINTDAFENSYGESCCFRVIFTPQ